MNYWLLVVSIHTNPTFTCILWTTKYFFFLLLSLRLESISRGKQSSGAALCTGGERYTCSEGPVLTRVRSPFFGFDRGATLACDAIVRVHDFRSYDFKLTLLYHILLILACYPK